METITDSVGKGGVNRPQDVRTIQNLLNKQLHLLIPLAPLAVNGLASPNLFFAIEEYQRRILKMHRPDGRVDPHGHTLHSLTGGSPHALPAPLKPGNPVDAPWIAIARAEIGTREIRGTATNSPRVLEYIGSFPYHPHADADGDYGSRVRRLCFGVVRLPPADGRRVGGRCEGHR